MFETVRLDIATVSKQDRLCVWVGLNTLPFEWLVYLWVYSINKILCKLVGIMQIMSLNLKNWNHEAVY